MPARISHVHLSVCLLNVWIVTKRKKVQPRFLHHMKELYPSFLTRRMVGGAKLTQKMSIFSRYSLVAPQP